MPGTCCACSGHGAGQAARARPRCNGGCRSSELGIAGRRGQRIDSACAATSANSRARPRRVGERRRPQGARQWTLIGTQRAARRCAGQGGWQRRVRHRRAPARDAVCGDAALPDARRRAGACRFRRRAQGAGRRARGATSARTPVPRRAVAVVGRSYWHAQRAAQAMDIEWQAPPHDPRWGRSTPRRSTACLERTAVARRWARRRPRVSFTGRCAAAETGRRADLRGHVLRALPGPCDDGADQLHRAGRATARSRCGPRPRCPASRAVWRPRWPASTTRT